MNFMNWFWGFCNWLSNMIRFEDTNDSVSSGKESNSDDTKIEICKISQLDTSN